MPQNDQPYDSDQEMAAPEEEHQENGDAEEEEDEEEYEIEAILEAKHGAFAGGKLGYLVKWKGYGDEHNSWVCEDDAGGAHDLIEEYWKKQKKTQARKSVGGRKSVTKEPSPEVPAPSVLKRGRASTAKAISVSDDEDDIAERQKKKTKAESASASVKKKATPKSTVIKPTVQKKRQKEPSPEAESEEDEEFQDMRRWKNAQTWEHLIERVDTVERTEEGNLFVYFTLNRKAGGNSTRCREDSKLCREKFPQKLLEFYESNLRWRKLDDDDENDD
ncbi:hypothetical protein BXZ70DRAFT_1052386 [Cristinia sonorae]|uniref:Chromo domain-containing protein n=1 Tax=Cristinia sonorae TaxID=1940300 RepID=A0A8K0XT91_9AGAR|nr:hypothetical protein BXZ70DRAFT_1052386 [Cristinia sonorae]